MKSEGHFTFGYMDLLSCRKLWLLSEIQRFLYSVRFIVTFNRLVITEVQADFSVAPYLWRLDVMTVGSILVKTFRYPPLC